MKHILHCHIRLDTKIEKFWIYHKFCEFHKFIYNIDYLAAWYTILCKVTKNQYCMKISKFLCMNLLCIMLHISEIFGFIHILSNIGGYCWFHCKFYDCCSNFLEFDVIIVTLTHIAYFEHDWANFLNSTWLLQFISNVLLFIQNMQS